MGNKRCFIKNCRSSSSDKENGQVSLFRIPPGKLEEWQEILSHKPGLGKHSLLCSRHFQDSDIQKGYEINGVFHYSKQFRLKKDAFPVFDLGCSRVIGCSNDLVDKDVIRQPLQNISGNSFVNKQKENKTPSLKSSLKQLKAREMTNNLPKVAILSSTVESNAIEEILTTLDKEETTLDEHQQMVLESLEVNVPNDINITSQNVLDNGSHTKKTNVTDTEVGSETRMSVLFLSELKAKTKLPPQWLWAIDIAEKTAMCNLFVFSENKLVIRTVRLLDERRVAFFVNGEKVNPAGQTNEFETFEDLTSAITNFHEHKICLGIVSNQSLFEVAKQSVAAKIMKDTVKAKNCKGLSKKSDMCRSCSNLKVYLTNRIKAKSTSKSRTPVKLQSLKRLNRRITNKNKEAVAFVAKLQEQRDKLAIKAKRESLDSYLETLPTTARTVVRMFLQKASLSDKDIHGKTMRWDSTYVVQCAMLKMKSSAAFRHLKERGLLPLPSEETLRQIVSSVDCDFGLNKLALHNIGEELKGLPEHERFVSLILDEAKIKPSMEWDKRRMTWRGKVDIGDTEVECDVPDGNATHVLVFVIRLYRKNAIQVFAIFAVKNGATGVLLSELIVKCICALYNVGAIVKNVVGDGASTNKSAYLEMGVSGKLEDGNHFITHPLDPKIKIYFLVDPPHLLKCTKNQVTNRKQVLIVFDKEGKQASNIYFGNYEVVYHHEKERHTKICPKLTEAHIYPNNFERQNVKRAAQFFSAHMGDAIKIYSNLDETKHLFRGLDPYVTQQFTYLMNDVFDVMNSRTRKEAIYNDVAGWAKKRKCLDTLATILDNTERMYNKLEGKRIEEEKQKKREDRDKQKEESKKKKACGKRSRDVEEEEEEEDEEDDLFKDPEIEKKNAEENKRKDIARKKRQKLHLFASKTTIEGWRLTIKSIIALVEELFDFNYAYVLTGMFNQDPVERWFGQMRHIDPHPTCRSSLHIFRMLALYSSTTRIFIKNSNVDQEEQLTNISSYKKCLVDRFKNNKKALEELKYEIEAKLLKELTVRFITDCTITGKATVDDMLVYDLCGYVLKARSSLVDTCKDCKKSVICKELELPEDFDAANYTILRNKGGLIFVTIPMFLSFRTIEAAIAAHFSNDKHVYKLDSFEVCINSISESNIHPLFCDTHRNQSLPFLIMEYVHIRYHFESKRYKNLHFSKSNTKCATQGKTKKSK